MLNEEFEKLKAAAEQGAYTSIAVNADGAPVWRGFVPWEKSVSAFNMRTPKITIAAEDLNDASVTEAIKKCRVNGLYIYVPLDDYSFIADLPGLQDLFILRGENIKDLSFAAGLNELFMFYIEDAQIPDLDPLAKACGSGSFLPGRCFGFKSCRIGDDSALKNADFRISEYIVRP